MTITEYETARAARIAENKRRLQELGLQKTLQQMECSVQDPRKPVVTKRKEKFLLKKEGSTRSGYSGGGRPSPVRRSLRIKGAPAPSLEEDEMFRRLGVDRLDIIAPVRRRRGGRTMNVDEILEQRKHGASSGVDSGLGVRIQGGRVYDSTFGVTCHWCRQKTLETHVVCSNEECNGNRLPVAFCRMCLRNRHGEDVDQAVASKKWICPRCRGSCGPGCISCCNCGPCRKRAGLPPTHQVIKEARFAGFDNVHDYLVHCQTGEDATIIAERKQTFPWGEWLTVPFQPINVDRSGKDFQSDSVEIDPDSNSSISSKDYFVGKDSPSDPELTESDDEMSETKRFRAANSVSQATIADDSKAVVTKETRIRVNRQRSCVLGDVIKLTRSKTLKCQLSPRSRHLQRGLL